MDLGLEGRVAVVTGAGSGIGAATARLLAAEGARVLLADRDTDAVEEVTAQIGLDTAICTTTDVADRDSVAAMVDTAVRTWGRLDRAVNNAGIAQPAMPIHQVTEELFDRLMRVNARGVWLCMKYEIAAMTAGGAIVNVTSVASHVATRGQGAYAGSKHAALGLTRGAALDCAAEGIRVCAVSPALVDTPMAHGFVADSDDPDVLEPIRAAHPIGRAATADEVAAAVVWQLSDRSAFCTGNALLVDGGYTAQ